jgi:type II secretory pathway pseudopilin PulG
MAWTGGNSVTVFKDGKEYVSDAVEWSVRTSASRTADKPEDVKWEIKPEVWFRNGDNRSSISVLIGVKGAPAAESRIWRKFDTVSTENEKPVLRAEYKDYRTFRAAEMNDQTIELSPYDIVIDPEGDELTFVDVKSKKSAVVDATLNTKENLIYLKFNGRGDSAITVEIMDAVDVYSYTFVAMNPDLKQLNIFARFRAWVQEYKITFWILLVLVLVLLLILIIVIAAVRKKKRIRAEIEALLVSEMELEEQMLRLAASPAPTYYQSYGYLSPTQNIQQNPQFMLGNGANRQPPPNNAMMLNAGQNKPQQNKQFNSIPEFDDDDL